MAHSLSNRLPNLAVLGALCAALVWQTALAQEEQATPRPSPEHELLQKDVGTWDADVTIWPQPGAEAMKSEATETNELLAGGLWLVSRFQGSIAGMPFSGVGAFGYDPTDKKYIGTWVDTMTPYLLTMKGDYDAATKTTTMISESRDPQTGQMTTSKMISRHIDENTRTFEIHMPSPDGNDWKMMEIQYKRRPE